MLFIQLIYGNLLPLQPNSKQNNHNVRARDFKTASKRE